MQGTPEQPGIIPRAVEHVIKLASQYEGSGAKTAKFKSGCTITVSYLEIYNEKVYDLLQPKEQDLPIREGAGKNIFIPNLEQVTVRTVDDFHKTYTTGCR